jgi:hypothetical protein
MAFIRGKTNVDILLLTTQPSVRLRILSPAGFLGDSAQPFWWHKVEQYSRYDKLGKDADRKADGGTDVEVIA